jgi:hypothetical protein
VEPSLALHDGKQLWVDMRPDQLFECPLGLPVLVRALLGPIARQAPCRYSIGEKDGVISISEAERIEEALRW